MRLEVRCQTEKHAKIPLFTLYKLKIPAGRDSHTFVEYYRHNIKTILIKKFLKNK
jgi:hypothetical protein